MAGGKRAHAPRESHSLASAYGIDEIVGDARQAAHFAFQRAPNPLAVRDFGPLGFADQNRPPLAAV